MCINDSTNEFVENWLSYKIPTEEFLFHLDMYEEICDDRNIVEVNYLVSIGNYIPAKGTEN